MLPELGTFALILAFLLALLQCVAPILVLGFKKNHAFFELSLFGSIGQFIFLSFAMLCLMMSFINNDLTVLYIREHSHQLLPFIYRIGAAWGGHEGSFLLWCLVLSTWTLSFILFAKKSLENTFFYRVLMVLGFLSAGFILFLLVTSNPFARDFPTRPLIGDDLTPLLQDPGLLFHPPILYSGYVGFAIGFAVAIAALMEKKFDALTAKILRPWIVLPWAFLGCGIVLGSWWAYRELGWGGWWFWDPVENASLLPWLIATALLHSLIVSEKRNTFKGWTILLAIITFSLSLIGTFLVRSGVLISVHAFASDPTRGLFLLGYLALIMGGALTLYAFRIKFFYVAPRFQLLSRETFLLLNSVFLLTAMATILLGTLYPIILDALDSDKISVGEPYFNTVFLPIILPLLILMAIAPYVHWGEHRLAYLWKKCGFSLFSSLILGFLIPILLGFQWKLLASIGISIGIWIIISTLQFVLQLWKNHQHLNLKYYSMIIAHLGIAIMTLGITINKSYSEERQVTIATNEIVTLAGYRFSFKDLQKENTKNYQSLLVSFTVQKNKGKSNLLFAEQRVYKSHEQTLSKPGILYNAFRDIYVALGGVTANGAWIVRIYYKPCVRWIWFGGFMLLLGGLITLLNYIWPHKEIEKEINA